MYFQVQWVLNNSKSVVSKIFCGSEAQFDIMLKNLTPRPLEINFNSGEEKILIG